MNAQNIPADASPGKDETRDVTFFKIPIGKLGLVGSVLTSGACGFIAFFVTFFLAIIGVTIYDSSTNTSMLNLTICYRYIAAPVGIVVLLVAATYLLSVWAHGKFSRTQ